MPNEPGLRAAAAPSKRWRAGKHQGECHGEWCIREAGDSGIDAQTWKSLETGSQSAKRRPYRAERQENAEANFALALKLTDTKDLNQAFDLQTQHARKQMETFVHQLEELRDLASQIIQESGATAAAMSKQAAQEMASATSQARTAPSHTSSSYAAAGGRRGN
jgi:hypothetical protein